MREERRKAKIQETVIIPEDLILFLKDVHSSITIGDEATTIESDDLLQCDSAYGGLIDGETGEFGFTYFSDEQDDRNKWEIILYKSDIEKITGGEVREFLLWACTADDCECKFTDQKETCSYCDWVDVTVEA